MNVKHLFQKILVILSLFFVISCCTTSNIYDSQKSSNIQEESMLEKAKLSAVLVMAEEKIEIQNKISTSTLSLAQESFSYTGSGVILGQVDTGTLILTAGHVCNPIDLNIILFHFPYYRNNIHNILVTHKFVILDSKGIGHPAITITLSKESDTCIMLSTPINAPVVKVSSHEPRISEKVYSLAFPRGLWYKGVSLIIEGFYSGPVFIRNKNTSMFSLRSAPGCSGGMIIDLNGNLVGMIHSIYPDFDQLTMAATLGQVSEILEMSEFMYSIGHDQYQLALIKEFELFKTTVNE